MNVFYKFAVRLPSRNFVCFNGKKIKIFSICLRIATNYKRKALFFGVVFVCVCDNKKVMCLENVKKKL